MKTTIKLVLFIAAMCSICVLMGICLQTAKETTPMLLKIFAAHI